MKNIAITFLMSLLFFACHKDDDEIIIAPDCLEDYLIPVVELEDSSIFVCYFECQTIYSSDNPYNYYYPCFNPQDSDQLAYYHRDSSEYNNTYELWVLDFCTGEQKMLVDDAFYGLDWSIKDWLIYTASDQNVWKIKSNGDSLTQLTSTGIFNRYPRWNDKGNKIACKVEIDEENYFTIADENGIQLDVIPELETSGVWCWIKRNRILYMVADSSYSSIMNYYDLDTKEIHYLHHLDRVENQDLLVQKRLYLPEENSVLWCAQRVIVKTNIEDGSYKILKEGLYQEKYLWHTVRLGKGELLFNKRSSNYVDYCKQEDEFDFFLIDMDGTDVQKLELE